MSTGVTPIRRRGRSSSQSTRVIANSSSPSDHVVARLEVREQRRRDRRHPRRRDDAVLRAFEGRDLLLERAVGRVAGPRVEVRGRVPLERPVDRGLLVGRRVEGERRRRVDGRVVGVGDGVGAFAGVDRPRREALAVRAFAHDGQSRVVRRGRAAPATRRTVPFGHGPTAWWTRLDARGAAAIAETWIPVGAPGFAGPAKARWRRGARQALRERRLAHRLCHPGTHRAVQRGHRGVRGVVSRLPARPARPRPVPGRAVRQRLRRPDRERPRRRVRAAAHGAEPLPGHRRAARDRGAGRRSGLALGHGHGARRRRPRRSRHRASPGASRGRAGSVAARSSRSASRARPATRSARRSCRPTTRPCSRRVPGRTEWYHAEGCGHLSVEAFWQSSKVIEVRYDRFLAQVDARTGPLAGL